MEAKAFEAGTDCFRLVARVHAMGDDLNVMIYGGDRPHIGAVAIASLGDDQRVTVKLMSIGSHREGAVAEPAARRLAQELNRTVVVCAGMHWQQIDRTGIDTVLENGERLVDAILDAEWPGRRA